MTDADVLAIWRRMQKKIVRRRRVTKTSSTFRVGQYVPISKEKMRFAKATEHHFSTEIYEVSNVIKRSPQVVYEFKDLKVTPIDGQFYR
jgi:hypothetical protein